jgi:hypothetical protein
MKKAECRFCSFIKRVFFLSFFFIDFVLYAQVESVRLDSNAIGSSNLFLPEGLEELIEKYKKANYTSVGISGFRVQIFSESGNNAKERAQQSLLEFNRSSEGVPSYLIYQQPNFKVRCGDFKTNAEARKLLKQLSGQYPGAYIVIDNIKIAK